MKVCEYCQSVIHGGHHSPDWCFDWLEPQQPIEVLPPKPPPSRGQLGTCRGRGCYKPTVPGKVLCSPCTRSRRVDL